jgi:Protein of unknown function with HXXEE motif
MPLPSFPALYLVFPLVLGVHNLDEYTHAQRRLANPQLQAHSSFFRSDVAQFAMILLTVASCLVALLNYTTRTMGMAIVAELSVFSLFFNAVGHIILSIKHRAWGPGTRSATFLVLPYTMAALTIMTRGSGQAVLALWPLAVGGLVALPAAILIALALAKGAYKLISRH